MQFTSCVVGMVNNNNFLPLNICAILLFQDFIGRNETESAMYSKGTAI